MFPDLSKSSGCIVYFFLNVELLKRLFSGPEMPQPLDITLNAFQTK